MDTQMGRGWLPMNAPLNLTWVEVEKGGIPSSYGLENDAFWDLMADWGTATRLETNENL